MLLCEADITSKNEDAPPTTPDTSSIPPMVMAAQIRFRLPRVSWNTSGAATSMKTGAI